MENACVYEALLKAVGIEQQLSPPPEPPSKIPLKNIPVCCTNDANDIIVLDGAHVCWQCGKSYDRVFLG